MVLIVVALKVLLIVPLVRRAFSLVTILILNVFNDIIGRSDCGVTTAF